MGQATWPARKVLGDCCLLLTREVLTGPPFPSLPKASQDSYPMDFPGGPVAKTPCSQSMQGAPGSTPGQGTRSHMLQLKDVASPSAAK